MFSQFTTLSTGQRSETCTKTYSADNRSKKIFEKDALIGEEKERIRKGKIEKLPRSTLAAPLPERKNNQSLVKNPTHNLMTSLQFANDVTSVSAFQGGLICQCLLKF